MNPGFNIPGKCFLSQSYILSPEEQVYEGQEINLRYIRLEVYRIPRWSGPAGIYLYSILRHSYVHTCYVHTYVRLGKGIWVEDTDLGICWHKG